ncbi:MAG: hypothetical protein IVW55_06440 [Chloroflexi bacterium]|nr:hypothetical protein [Chloroflexota bacterium]
MQVVLSKGVLEHSFVGEVVRFGLISLELGCMRSFCIRYCAVVILLPGVPAIGRKVAGVALQGREVPLALGFSFSPLSPTAAVI